MATNRIGSASLFLTLLTAPICFAIDSAPGGAIDFNKQIRPILTKHCTECHGGVKQAGDLSFVYEDSVENVVEKGSPEDSYLIERVVDQDDEYRMPPPGHGPRLAEQDVELLKRWIKQGAEWSKPWAFTMPTRHAKPKVSQEDWPRQPFDYFVLNRLEQSGIQPALDERPTRWLRRVTLDLIALPPTLEERSAFLDDLSQRGEPAYATVVDRLLSSPRFGERWASVWFDLVRYADSRGQGEDTPRDIWKYRNWVIDALNNDMPYDEFTIKQIAGDLLPDATIEDRLATAVHRLTHSNEEGGTDDEEFRIAAVLDRVTTTWQTWQGVTMGCVQCHDHPYDPIEHEEFYKFTAYFNNTADCDLEDEWPTLAVPLDPTDYPKAGDLDRRIARLTEELWEYEWRRAHQDANWSPSRISAAKTLNATKVVIESKPTHDQYHTIGTVSKYTTITVELPLASDTAPITGVRLTALPLKAEAPTADAEVGFVMSKISLSIKDGKSGKSKPVSMARLVGDEPFPYSPPGESLEDNNTGFGAFTRMNHVRNVVALPTEPIIANGDSKLVISVRYNVFNLAAFVLVARRGEFALTSDENLAGLAKDEEILKREAELKKLRDQRAAIKSIATPVMAERPDHLARPSRVFIRGLFLTKGDSVEPGVPGSLGGDGAPIADRLALANWLVSDNNALTARVAVNRFWARMFGVGLVETEEDFGSAGELPSHADMLDDLAVRFREDHAWSVKSLLREVALSRTYRQSSQIRPDLLEQDSANRLLARGPRHSLPAETLRDQMLAISGLLSTKMHGAPVHPPLPPGVWKARRGTWKTPPVGDKDRYRRSVYTYVKRSVPFPTYAAFDAPSRDFCITRRLRSNTPLQPLMLLNDSASVECAQAFAQLMEEQPGKIVDQIAWGFLRSTCRDPHPTELEELRSMYDELSAAENQEFALQSVAGVLLNLDEVITK